MMRVIGGDFQEYANQESSQREEEAEQIKYGSTGSMLQEHLTFSGTYMSENALQEHQITFCNSEKRKAEMSSCGGKRKSRRRRRMAAIWRLQE